MPAPAVPSEFSYSGLHSSVATSDVRDQLQTALGAQYTLERELGRGGMATVFLARDTKHGRPVALKVLHPDLAASLGPERFRREITLAAGLHHPHILCVYDSGETASGQLWFTMPYVEGESLRDRLRREPQLTLGDALRITGEVADALGYAHQRGVIHRDVKPENILLTSTHALLADFGVARPMEPPRAQAAAGVHAASVLTESGFAVGTPAYASPEQASGDRALDGRTDVYSLGTVLYEMLAGELPFTGPTPQSLLAKRLTTPAPSVRVVRPEISVGIEAALGKALARTPADRFATAPKFAQALEAGRTSGTTPPVRHRLPLVAGAAAAVLLLVGGAYAWRTRGREPAGPSIAVLPFENLGAARDDEYFSDGMTQELIGGLAQVRGLRVAARTSSFAYKGKHEPVRDIGRALDVHTVLEGTVQRAGQRLRLAAQLVDCASGDVIWSQRYDRETRDVFGIQDDLTQAIVGALRVRLASNQTVVPRHTTGDLEAYDLYLRGRFYWNSRKDASELRRAIGYFQQAIARDSGFAPAYAGLADAYSLSGVFGFRPSSIVFPLARDAAEHAVRLDSNLAETHTSLGIVAMFYDWDFAAAEREYRRAIALDPNYPAAHLFHGWNRFAVGDNEQGLEEIRTAGRLDPLNVLIRARIAGALLGTGQVAAADSAATKAYALDSAVPLARSMLADVRVGEKRYSEAIALYPSGEMSSLADVGGRGVAYARWGHRAEALRFAHELERAKESGLGAAYPIAEIFASMGEADSAFAWLDRAVVDRESPVIFVRIESRFIAIQHDPRFAAFVKRVGGHAVQFPNPEPRIPSPESLVTSH